MRIFLSLVLCFCITAAALADGGSYAASSILASGKWVKIQVGETGMYKITYDELRKMGFDPEKVSVHGYGGWPLDENFGASSAQPYIDDLPATSIYRGSNYIIFYGRGPVKWAYNASQGAFEHTNNPYSTYGYYFLTDATETKDMAEETPPDTGGVLNITSYDEYRVHEQELYSPNNSGRQLFGEPISGNATNTITTFSIPGILEETAQVRVRAIARVKSDATMTLLLNGEAAAAMNFRYYKTDYDNSYFKAAASESSRNWTGEKTESIRATMTYSNANDENVYLDYIRLQVKRELRQYGSVTFFRSISSINNVSKFTISNANANTVVFDVTDPVNPILMKAELNGTDLSFAIGAGAIREFAAVQVNNTLQGWTRITGDVENQDLHATPQADMVIIAPNALRAQAERLAERHRNNGLDKLIVEVVDPQKIYNEFSSGTPDATAYRRFMKMLYDRSLSGAGTAPRYLLLFGDGAMDNRLISSGWKNISFPNRLLTFQSENSLTGESYVTDDYFGAMNDEAFSIYSKIQLGIGRFPVRTVSEAAKVVNKVISYMDNQITGSWKNKLCFVADDGNATDTFDTMYMYQSNVLADLIRTNNPEFLTSKIFFDAYKKETIGGTSTYPGVQSQIQKELSDDNGLLIINYIGHGNTQSLSDEKVINMPDINKYNFTKLPLWITATCDFTRFDDNSTSAGENVFLSESGGIALVTTARVVYTGGNYAINTQVINHLFERKNGRRLTLGEVIQNSKNALPAGTNKLNFLLIGDPAMKLAYPEYRMQIQEINGQPVGDEDIPFRAQETITVKGVVLDPDEAIDTGFTGDMEVTILDSKQEITTLDNNNTGNTFTYTDYPNRIYMGHHQVKEGTFEFSFTVPTDISYSNDNGIINLYASDSDSGNEAQGAFERFKVGGTAVNPIDDTEGPKIRQLYLNDSTFTSGGQVNTTPFFYARLWDKAGVNISGSSLGHDITLSIFGASANANHILNSYYRLLPDSDGEGQVKFSIPELAPGMYSAEFRVWDIMNNSTLETFSFEVVEGLKPVFSDVFAAPSPARESLQFRIYHNRPESEIAAEIVVYDLAGRLMWKTKETGTSGLDTPLIVNWNLTSSGGARLSPGVYIFRAAISTNNSKEVTKAKKLIILAQ